MGLQKKNHISRNISDRIEAILPSNYEKYAKYRWEFLRRNPEYIEDWNKLNKLNKIHRDKKEQDFLSKWKIAYPFCPEKSYANFTQGDNGDKAFSPASMFLSLFPDSSYSKPIKPLEEQMPQNGEDIPSSRDIVIKTGNLKVEIINYSKKRLKEEFNLILNDFKDNYDKVTRYQPFIETIDQQKIYYAVELQKESMQRPRLDDYDILLNVYDLHEKGISWSQIQKRLNLNSIQTARNHYTSACRLIKRGIEIYLK
ncbi:MAG TPA: hypothetical protein P5294_02860 [Smithellaceae bacterium]|nr:hypothetical protein [Smithellaceae bacterium]HRV25454.1 hypothetical protein [Smithellaceae bacterium]